MQSLQTVKVYWSLLEATLLLSVLVFVSLAENKSL